MEFPRLAKHISHEHRLIFNEALKDEGETKKVVCYGCLEPINPEHAFFSCKECDDFFLHKKCEELPWQTEHPMHPHALLTLLPHGEGPDSLCVCHVCGRDWERFTYSCDDCKFYVCILCTLLSKIKHVSHDHLLIPSEVEESDDEKVVCYGCQKQIADHQMYSCSDCNFFLHSTCAALPTQVKQYPFHPEHPLTLFPRPPNFCLCNVCEESSEGFTYYCELCNFNACRSCVMLGNIQHMSHWHPLFPMEPQITNDQEVACRGCKKQIANDNAYICRDCHFFLHKTCAELLNETQHVSHRKHMLTLLPRSSYVSSRCRVCNELWDAFTYRCEPCMFYICIPCFLLGKIRHPSHNHPIIPMEAHSENGKAAICYGCRKPAVDHTYSCKECNFLLHKTCVDLSDEIQNNSHPQHSLILVLVQRWDFRYLHCACCGESWGWFMYWCEVCRFKLCVPCAWLSSDLPWQIEKTFLHPHSLSLFCRQSKSYLTWTCNCCGEISEPFLYRCNQDCKFYICMSCASCALPPQITKHKGHRHPLTIMRRALFRCDACGIQGEDHPYVCAPCKFWVHKSCVALESTFHCVQHTEHPLTLAFSLPKAYLKYDLNCDICAKRVSPPRWVYYCAPCRFFAHVKCATSEVKSTRKLRSESSQRSEIEEEEALDYKVIRLPMPGECMDQVSYLLGTANCGEIQRAEEVTHNIHPHPLILCDNATTKDEELVCNACVQPIIDSYYRCSQRCSGLSLHISCTELPDEVRHPSHPEHLLFLYPEARAESSCIFRCHNCTKPCNGFRYRCEPCNFALDIKCALIQDAILHDSHQHPLSPVQSRGGEYCDACGDCGSWLTYGCDCCGYYLDTFCAMLPPMGRHKYDPHPLTLIYPPFPDHLDEFYCEECQTEISPKFWLYHCRECNQSFHMFCLLPYFMLSNLSFAGNYVVSKNLHEHQHFTLRSCRGKSSPPKCNFCGAYYKVNLECAECTFSICVYCVLATPFDLVQWVR